MFVMTARLMTAYGLIALLVAMAAWGLWRLRYTSHTQQVRRGRLRKIESARKSQAAKLADDKSAFEADSQ